jgi:hypothetical protein
MNSAVLEPLVVIFTTIVIPLGVGALAGVLDRKDPRLGLWSEYFLAVIVVAVLLLISPSAWIYLLSEHDRDDRALLSHGYLIFAPWLGAFLTMVVGTVGGALGIARHRQRRAAIAAAGQPSARS